MISDRPRGARCLVAAQKGRARGAGAFRWRTLLPVVLILLLTADISLFVARFEPAPDSQLRFPQPAIQTELVYDIPRGNAYAVVTLIADAANVRWSVLSKELEGRVLGPLHGRYTWQGALNKVFEGEGCTWRREPQDSDDSFVVTCDPAPYGISPVILRHQIDGATSNRITFDVPRGPAGPTFLRVLARARVRGGASDEAAVRKRLFGPLRGAYTLSEALDLLTKDTGCTWEAAQLALVVLRCDER